MSTETRLHAIEEYLKILESAEENSLDKYYPVGSVYITKTNVNPSTFLGGEWSLVDKDFKFNWITSGFTFNTTNTQNGAFAAIPNDKTIELRFTFKNKVAISDDIFTIGTLNPLSIGITDGRQLHSIYGQVNADGLNAIGLASLDWDNNVGTLAVSDWVTRATAYPTTTGQGCQLSMILTAQKVTSMMDTFCDKFYWHRTA